MCNAEIRMELIKKGMRQYELADILGMNDQSLSRKLRKELPEKEKQRILKVIRDAREKG